MSRRPRPELKPLKRYPKPRYPSHEDPNPLEQGYEHPCPVSPRLAAAVAGLGIVASQGSEAGDGKEPSNPFAIARSGLPHRSSAFGTGQPMRLREEQARRVIERIFREAGIELEANKPIREDGLTFIADGYDPGRRIGYVYGDWTSLDEDAVRSWMLRDAAGERPEDQVRRLVGRLSNPDDRQLAENTLARKPGPERDKVLAMILRRFHERRLSLAEARKLEDEAARKERFIAVISSFDRRFEYRYRALTKEEKDRLAQVPEKKSRMMNELFAKKALENLEKAVREYITWARSQGLR